MLCSQLGTTQLLHRNMTEARKRGLQFRQRKYQNMMADLDWHNRNLLGILRYEPTEFRPIHKNLALGK